MYSTTTTLINKNKMNKNNNKKRSDHYSNQQNEALQMNIIRKFLDSCDSSLLLLFSILFSSFGALLSMQLVNWYRKLINASIIIRAAAAVVAAAIDDTTYTPHKFSETEQKFAAKRNSIHHFGTLRGTLFSVSPVTKSNGQWTVVIVFCNLD